VLFANLPWQCCRLENAKEWELGQQVFSAAGNLQMTYLPWRCQLKAKPVEVGDGEGGLAAWGTGSCKEGCMAAMHLVILCQREHFHNFVADPLKVA
jgi:hypothetical protein